MIFFYFIFANLPGVRTPIEPGHYDDLQKASVPTAAAGFAAVGVVGEADAAADVAALEVAADVVALDDAAEVVAHDAAADVAAHDDAAEVVAHDAAVDVAAHDAVCDIVYSELCL